MTPLAARPNESVDRTFKVGLVLWCLTIVLTGTHLRVRVQDGGPTLDWLILTQIMTAGLSGLVGLRLLRRSSNWGIGSASLIAYISAAGLSILFTVYSTTVFGYWFLLANVCVLTLGLVKQSGSMATLRKLESAWLVTVTLIVLKDAITSLFFFQTTLDGDPFRLGSQVTHPAALSFNAALAFWLSFRRENGRAFLWNLARIAFIVILVLARTRMSILALIVGGLIKLWFLAGNKDSKRLQLRGAAIFGLGAVVTIFLIALSVRLPIAEGILSVFNREHDVDQMMTLSARTEIWPYVVQRLFDGPIEFAFGHGYGVSRLALNGHPGAPLFKVDHTHNAFLEVFFSMGVMGVCAFVLLSVAAISWLFHFRRLRNVFRNDFAIHAVVVVAMLFLSSMTEPSIGSKIGPVDMIFFFYIAALDQRKEALKPTPTQLNEVT